MTHFSSKATVVATIVDNYLTEDEMASIARLFLSDNYEITLKTNENFGFSPSDMAEIFSYISQGHKINAIRVYRSKTGLGLKEAKDAVEELIDKIRI